MSSKFKTSKFKKGDRVRFTEKMGAEQCIGKTGTIIHIDSSGDTKYPYTINSPNFNYNVVAKLGEFVLVPKKNKQMLLFNM